MKIKDMLVLDGYNLKYNNWEYVKKDWESVTFKNKKSGKLITLRR